jgi:hypothetical protein
MMLFTMMKKYNGGASCNVSSPYDESNSGANPLTAPMSHHCTYRLGAVRLFSQELCANPHSTAPPTNIKEEK